MIDEHGDENCICKIFEESEADIKVVFGFFCDTGYLEVVDIVVEINEVVDVHCEVSAICVYSNDKRPDKV